MKNLRDYKIIKLNNDNKEDIWKTIPSNEKHKTLLEDNSGGLWNYDYEHIGYAKDFDRYFIVFGKTHDSSFTVPITTNYGRFPSNEEIKKHISFNFKDSEIIVLNIIELKSREDLLDWIN